MRWFVLAVAWFYVLEVVASAMWLAMDDPPQRTRGSVAFGLVSTVVFLVWAVAVLLEAV